MTFLRTLNILALAGAALLSGMIPLLAQETKTVRFAEQFGIGYLPLSIMQDMKLVEKQAQAQGLGQVTVEWTKLTGGAPINDALISGQIDIAAGGVGPLLTIWAKTRGSLNVKGVAALNSMPLYLNTINPNVATIKDFTEKDRIALPSVKVSIQAVTLQMAAEKVFGEGKYDQFDALTVSMSHPDGFTNMMSGKSEITGHFTSAPFMYQELEDKRVKRVLSSYEVIGGPATFNLADGSYDVGAVTGTASFRFSPWLDEWFAKSGAKVIIGKGGMSKEVYQQQFLPVGAVYLTTVGYGTGALLGRGIKAVRDVRWLAELGIAQAMWLFDVSNFGPFLVESDTKGNSLFERENEAISRNLAQHYEGTKPPALRRYGETDDRSDELI
jgi:tartrate dehydratase beta subunit/fumarate hydratase class I family protein